MPDPTTFHRSFEWKQPEQLISIGGRLYQTRDGRLIPVDLRQSPSSPAPSMGVPSARRDDKFLPQYQALYLGSHEIWMREKNGQRFQDYATRWELVWSRLVIPSVGWRFIPVVDQNILVVGHCGEVWGENLLFSKAGPPSIEPTMGEVFGHNRLFVGTKEFYQNADYEEVGGGSVFHKYLVMTDIHGEVLFVKHTGVSNNGTAISVSMVEILSWASLLKSAIKLLTMTIGKLGARTLARFRPPTPPEPPVGGTPRAMAPKALPPGPSAPRALPPGPPAPRALPPAGGTSVPEEFRGIMTPVTDEVVEKLPNGRVARLIMNRATGLPDRIPPPPHVAIVPSINQAIDLIKDARELYRAGRLSEGALIAIRDELYPLLFRLRPGIAREIGRRFVPAQY
jgi:hypothetical protein